MRMETMLVISSAARPSPTTESQSSNQLRFVTRLGKIVLFAARLAETVTMTVSMAVMFGAMFFQLTVQLVQNGSQLGFLLIGQHAKQVGRHKLALLGELRRVRPAGIGQVHLDNPAIGGGFLAFYQLVLLELAQHLAECLRANTEQESEVFLADALLHGDHGDDAHLPTTTMPLVMPTCTAVMMSMALVPWAVIVILFTTAIRSTTITMASPLLFKLPMPVPMAMPVAAAMPMMFAMPVTARPLAVDVAHDHAGTHEFLQKLFVLNSHFGSFQYL